MDKHTGISRRSFIGKSAAAAAGVTILPSSVVSGFGRRSPSDKLNIAGVGVGGKGNSLLRAMESENIVALCDVDWEYARRTFEHFPKAKKFWDWRVMLDEMAGSIDGIVVATADHTHAVIAAHAMTMGIHVYVEKPLTHTVYESRLLAKLADKYQVATQMGNQGASNDDTATMVEWINSGEIGEVTKVEAFTNRPIWPQGLNPPSQGQWVPDTLNWDLFVGPARMRPYNEAYTPWTFRGWWDFGTGALGDMACHVLHPVFKGLNLGYPVKVQGSSTQLMADSAPGAQKVHMTFPARTSTPHTPMPEVEVHWYDGGLRPAMPEGWPEGRDMNRFGGGVLFYGSKDTLICGCYGREPWLLSGRTPVVEKTERRIPVSHEMDWVRACKESRENRVETASPFREAGPFNEMVVMGVLAVRLQGLNKELEWDGESMQFTNIAEDETIRFVKEDRFGMQSGRPSFQREMTEPVYAAQFARELISHNYREGWSLPDMPG